MAIIANIAVVDGKTTPQTHTFVPFTTVPSALYKRTDVANQPAVAWESVQVLVSPTKKADGVNFVDVEVVIPVLEQASGGAASGYVAPPRVAHELRAKVKFYCHNRSVEADRKDLRTILINVLNHIQVADAVDRLTPAN